MNDVIVLVRLGWALPRLAVIALCGLWLFGLGLAAPRVFAPRAYSSGVKAMYAASVCLYLAAPVFAALTL